MEDDRDDAAAAPAEQDASGEGFERRPWSEGPDGEVPEESWLGLDDDELLHRIETLGSEEDEDDRLLEVVHSDRHFFIRQEAAKRIHDRTQLFAFEDDRHVGQILVRHLTRREDLTYLERLAIRSRHAEVRAAAQVQLARVWRWLEAPRGTTGSYRAITLSTPAVPALPAPEPEPSEAPLPGGMVAGTSAALALEGVDASLLVWAAHFIVEHAWGRLGTTATRELLRRTHRDLASSCSTLASFHVSDDAHVTAELTPGSRIRREAVQHVAAWMTAFREAVRQVAADVEGTTVRGCTALMADALRDAGFYAACDQAEAARRG